MSSGPHNSPLSATVVICTRGRAQQLELCLRAVARLHYPCYEALVVENGPIETRTRAVAEAHGARYLHSPRIGLSRARNDGARACHTDLVAYIDDDAEPHPEWLAALAREFAAPQVMAVAGEIVPNVSSPDAQASSFVASALRRRHVVDRQTPGWFSLANFGGVGDGGNMAFRRSAFELWGGFDERLGRGAPLDSAEEHLAFLQLILLGYRCVHTPEAIVFHAFPQSPAEWRQFNVRNLTNAVAYAALLWTEFPQTRRLLLEHLRRRSSGERRRARAASGIAPLTWIEKLGVVAAGLRLFWRLPRASHPAAMLTEAAVPDESATPRRNESTPR